jgi:lysophospholipase L1-like esterase
VGHFTLAIGLFAALWVAPFGARPAAAGTAAQIDLLLIGDSITEGFGAPPGFRDDLRARLDADPLNTYTFVGSSGSPPLQGHFLGGQQIEDFYPPGFGNGWGNGSFDTTPDMGPPGTPDMVAIHLGTNDLNTELRPFAPYSFDHGVTLNSAQSGELAEYLLFLIQWHDGPHSLDLQHIVLSTIIPMQNRDRDVRDFNNAVIAMAEDLAEGTFPGPRVRVTLADHYQRFITNPNLFTFGPGDWMDDALHPNNAGYVQMADVYHRAITAAVDDATPPTAVSNLAAADIDSTRVTLTFTASGDDASFGQAQYYDIRYATEPLNTQNFGLATQAVGEPQPRSAGATETVQVTGLLTGKAYYFALKVTDDAGNRSSISNTLAVTTPGFPSVVLTLCQGLNGYTGTEENSMVDVTSDENWGGDNIFSVGGVEGSSGHEVRRALVRFDLSAVPADAIIRDARFRLFNLSTDNSSPLAVRAYRVTKDWVEGTQDPPDPENGSSCWDAAQLGSLPWSAPGAAAASDLAQNDDPNFDRLETPEASATLGRMGTFYEWDLTGAVGHWLDGTWDNNGILLQADDEGDRNLRRFYSSETQTDPHRLPCLVVTYATPPVSVNLPPTAEAGGPYTGGTFQDIQFDGMASTDPEGQEVTYQWSFGDGSTATGPTPTHSYAICGIYTISLIVNDGMNNSAPDNTTVGISLGPGGEPPSITRLHGGFPNPFATSTRIGYDLSVAADVRLRIYDINGRTVRILVNGPQPPGCYEATWDGVADGGEQAASGTYFCRFEAPGVLETQKLLIQK